MNNGLLGRPLQTRRYAVKGGFFRFMKPQRYAPDSISPSQGVLYDFTMSANTVQSAGTTGLVTSVLASTEQSGFNAYRAFDASTTEWVSDSTGSPISSWLRVNFSTAQIVRGYAITAGGNATIMPKSWTIEGSNDGTFWYVIDTQTLVANWTNTERRAYSFNNATAYSSVRINVTNVENTAFGTGYTAIATLELYN